MSYPYISVEKAIQNVTAKNPELMASQRLPTIAELEATYGSQPMAELPEQEVYHDTPETIQEKASAPVVMPSAKPQKRVTHRGKRVPSTALNNKHSTSEIAFLRDFPKTIADFAKSKFPTAKSQSKAITALIYVTSGKAIDVDDEIKELAKTWSEEKNIEAVEERLIKIEQQHREQIKLVEEMRILMTYLLFDRLGFRRHNPMNPSGVDLSESGMDDFTEAIKLQVTALRKRQAVKDGRLRQQ